MVGVGPAKDTEGLQIKTTIIISRKQSKRSGYAHGDEEIHGMYPFGYLTFTTNLYLIFWGVHLVLGREHKQQLSQTLIVDTKGHELMDAISIV